MTAIVVGYCIAVLGVFLAYQLTREASVKRKYIVWGITTMVAISPFFSFALGLSFAFMTHNGWNGLIMFILFPILFLTGLVLLLMGIFKKEANKEGESV